MTYISGVSAPLSNPIQDPNEKSDKSELKQKATNLFQASTSPLMAATEAASSVGEVISHSATTAASTAASVATATTASLGKAINDTAAATTSVLRDSPIGARLGGFGES